MQESLLKVVELVNEMSPFLLLGFLFAGILHVFIPGAVYSRYLSGHSFRSVFYAALLGVPLPLCSCGVIPTAMGLRKEGASKGATVSFLIATPETGVDSIAATYSLMGLPFAIVRPIVAFCTSLFAGTLVNTFDKDKEGEVIEVSEEDTKCSCGCGCHDCCDDDDDCCCGDHDDCCCGDHDDCCCGDHDDCCGEHRHEKHEGCCCGKKSETNGFFSKCVEALRYGYIEMMGDIGKWLVVGLVIAGLITVFVPDSFFTIFKGNTLLSMLLVMCIAIPMYICATGSIPIAVALIMKGLTPGAALVLLMAGPACNMASLIVINRVLGKKTQCLYLMSIIFGAFVAGNIIDLMPTEWFMPTLMSTDCCEKETSWFNWLCTGVLCALLLYAAFRHIMAGCGHNHVLKSSKHHDHDCCHEHNHDCCQNEGAEEKEETTHEFKIKGLNCSHCAAKAKGALEALPGVESATVNHVNNSAVITGIFDKEAITAALKDFGFTAEF